LKVKKTCIVNCPCCGSEYSYRSHVKKYCSYKCKIRSKKARHYAKHRERENLKSVVRNKKKRFIKRFIKELIKRHIVELKFYKKRTRKVKKYLCLRKLRVIKKLKKEKLKQEKLCFCKVCDQKHMFPINTVYCSKNCEKAWENTFKKKVKRNNVKWLTFEQKKEIAKMYAFRPPNHDVDHIIPSNGKNVSGLHVPWNLQYLTYKNNSGKGVNW